MEQILTSKEARVPPSQRPVVLLHTAREVSRRVVFSIPHIARLERAGDFPARRLLGQARVAWYAHEVTAWMQAKLIMRGAADGASVPALTHADRFISKREVCRLVLYSARSIDAFEAQGTFPRRVRIGPQRTVWLEREVIAWINTRPPRP